MAVAATVVVVVVVVGVAYNLLMKVHLAVQQNRHHLEHPLIEVQQMVHKMVQGE